MTYPNSRDVTYGYDAVGNRALAVDSSRPAVTRWAASAVASSQYRSSGVGSAAAAVGPPDVTNCPYTPNAMHWVSDGSDTTSPRLEWLELTYAQAEAARGVRIHETYQGGFVMRTDLIEENGTTHTVYSGGDQTSCGNWLTIAFAPTSYKVKKVKVYTRIVGSEGIDAVGMDVSAVDSYQYNAFNQLTGVTGADGSATSFAYDGNGNQTAKAVTPAGGTAQTTQYVYNDDNRLVGISLPNGQSDAFEYDANGLRTKKTDSFGTTRYLLDGMSVIAQYASDGARQAYYTQSLARIDEVLSVTNSQGKYWYQADALGSTYALADNSGKIAARGGYDVFGAPVAISGNVGQPFGFTGREHDLDSGLVYARARYLNPSVGRWDRPDPAGFVDGPNRYAYVGNNAVNVVDPLGLAGLPACGYCTLQPDAQVYWDLQAEFDDSRHHLARIILAEGGNEPQWTRIGIGVVVLNRVEMGGYYMHNPVENNSSIAAVVSARSGTYKQFDGYRHPKLWFDPDTAYNLIDPGKCDQLNKSIRAAMEAMLTQGASIGFSRSVLAFAVPPSKPTVDAQHYLKDIGTRGGGRTVFYEVGGK